MTLSAVRRHGVLVVGAGLAGLTAADRLARADVDVQVLEADSVAGGRVRGEAGGPDTGAEFVGAPHRLLRAQIAQLGLCTRPARLDRAPVLWRLGAGTRISWHPPGSLQDLRRLSVALWRLRNQALALDSDRPWNSVAITDLDNSSLAEWLTGHGATPQGLDLTEALIGGFATRSISEVSAAQVGWWITAAGGLVAALRSGQQDVVAGGAHQIPHRLAARLDAHIHLDTPVFSIRTHADGVEITTQNGVWAADAAVVAVPIPALRRIAFDPPLLPAFSSALSQLAYGRAIKITAALTAQPRTRHRAVLGGHPVSIAWRHERTVAGIATRDTPLDALVSDLAGAFGLRPHHLDRITLTNWTQQQHIGGSYLIYAPGQITRLAPALLETHHARLRFAGSDFSSWPNSMEGAVASGQSAADTYLHLDPGMAARKT